MPNLCPAEDTSSSPYELRKITAMLLLVLTVVLIYSGFLGNPLVFDDLSLVETQFMRGFNILSSNLDLRCFYYATFSWTDYFAGTNIVWHRLVNLLFHTITVLALYRFLSLLFRSTIKDSGTDRFAFWGAMFFAVHPVAVYGTAYLIERSIVMAALFSLLAMHAFLKGLTSDKPQYLYFSILFYFVAVFSKEHAVMLPAAIAATTLLVRRPSIALLREIALPFTMFLVISVWVVLKCKGYLGQSYEPLALKMLESQTSFQIANAYTLSILMQGTLFFKYLWLWLLPYVGWMSVDMRVAFPDGFLSWPYTFGFLAFLAYPFLAVTLLLRGEKSGLAGFAMLFPWLMFLTELTAVRIQEPFVLYRSYLWMLTLPAIFPVILSGFAPRRVNVVLGLTMFLLAASAWNRLDSFSDTLKIWDDVVTKNTVTAPGFERGYLNRGRIKRNRTQYREALEDFNKAIQLNPKYYFAYSDRASIYINMKRNEEALQDLNRAIGIKPDYATPYITRGNMKLRAGNFQEAIEDYDTAIAINHSKISKHSLMLSYNNRGVAHMNLGDNNGALKDFDAALKLDVSSDMAAKNRDNVMERIKKEHKSSDR